MGSVSSHKIGAFIAAVSSLTLFSLDAAPFTVSNTADSGAGSLRQAIIDSNTAGGTNSIAFTTTGTTLMLSTYPAITNNLTITGPTSGSAAAFTVNGANNFQAFRVGRSVTSFSISNLNIQNTKSTGPSGGNASNGGGGGGGSFGAGSAIYFNPNSVLLTASISNVNFDGNSAVGGVGGSSLTAVGATEGGGGGGGAGGNFGGVGGAGAVPTGNGAGGGGGGGGDIGGAPGSTGLSGAGNSAGGAGGNSGGSTGGTGGASAGNATTGGGGGGGGAEAAVNGQPGGAEITGNGGAGGNTARIGGGGGGGSASLTAGAPRGGNGGGSQLSGSGGGGGGATRTAVSGGGGDGGSGGLGAGGGGGGAGFLLADGGTSIIGTSGFRGFGGTGGDGFSDHGGGGGGGSGFGGALAIFSINGPAHVTVTDGSFGNASSNTATGGAGGTSTNAASNGTTGETLGQDIYLGCGATLTFDVSGILNIPNPIEGEVQSSGAKLVKTGPGILKLNGTSLNAYNGTSGTPPNLGTRVMAGTLNVNGSLNSDVFVDPGATLSGIATFFDTVSGSTGMVINEGTVSPGNSIGTMILFGDYTQSSSGTLSIGIDPSGNSSQLQVGGSSFLDGAIVFVPDPGTYVMGTTYTIITDPLGTRTGTFSSVSFTTNIGFTAEMIYLVNGVLMRLTSGLPLIPLAGLHGNALRTAIYINCLAPTATGDLASVITQLISLSGDAQEDALESIGPAMLGSLSLTEEATAVSVRTSVSHRTAQLHSVECPIDQTDKMGLSVWADGFGQYDSQGKFREQFGYRAWNGGVIVGLDYQVVQNFYLGAAGSYTHSHIHWKESAGEGDINSYYGGIYGTWYQNMYFIDFSAFGASNDYDETRNLKFGTIDRKAKSDHDGFLAMGNLSGGATFRLHNSHVLLQPFISLDYLYLHEDSFKEHGADSLDLHVSRKKDNFLRSEIGLFTSYCMKFDQGKFIPEVKLSYVHESHFKNKRYTAFFNDIPANSCGTFTVDTTPRDRNLFNPEIGFNVWLLQDALSISAYYEAEVGSKYTQQEARLHFEYRF